MFTNSILDTIDVRVAKGRMFEDLEGNQGDADSALWARVPGHLAPSAATLAIFGDYVSGSVSQPIGLRVMGRSLDKHASGSSAATHRVGVCDIRIHAIIDGYAQGNAFLWSQDGELLATASQSMGVRLWPGEGPPGR